MLRALLILMLIALLLLLDWPQGGGGAPEELPRIVCVAGEKFVRCPSECEFGPDGQPDCRCQDFWFRRGEEPLRFSHSLCR